MFDTKKIDAEKIIEKLKEKDYKLLQWEIKKKEKGNLSDWNAGLLRGQQKILYWIYDLIKKEIWKHNDQI